MTNNLMRHLTAKLNRSGLLLQAKNGARVVAKLGLMFGVCLLTTACGSKFNGTWDADELTCNDTAMNQLYVSPNRFTLIVDGEKGSIEQETSTGACEKSIDAFFEYFGDDEVDIIIDGKWDCDGTCTADTDCNTGTNYNNTKIGTYKWKRDGDDLTLTSEDTFEYICQLNGGAAPGHYEFRKIK